MRLVINFFTNLFCPIKILGKALHAIINGNQFKHTSLLSYLATIHLVYYQYEQEIMWFGRLTSIIPGILLKMSGETLIKLLGAIIQTLYIAIACIFEYYDIIYLFFY